MATIITTRFIALKTACIYKFILENAVIYTMRRLLFLLLLFALSFGQITEPKLVQQVNATVVQSGSIHTSAGGMYSISLNITIPQNTSYQAAETGGKFVFDSDGNRLAHLSDSNPANPYSYSIHSNITANERVTTSLPDAYSIPPYLMAYTQPTASVQSDSPGIHQFAEWITANSTSDFEKISKLADWVHYHVNYELDLVGQRKDAIWVLENKRGVCVEYATLFAAFARSLGYPTRFVLGQAYGDYGWLGHAWNEVYLGKWVPVDATWLEVGHLDATHIEFSRGIMSEAGNKVIAKISNDASLYWEKPNFAGESGGTQIHITSDKSAPSNTEYTLSIASPLLGFGDQTLVTFSMKGSDYRLVDLRLVSCRSDTQIIPVQDPIKSAILEPGKTTYISWIVATNPALDPSVVYTCPLTLNSRYLKERSASVTVSNAVSRSGFTAFLSDSSIALGEMISAYVRATPGERLVVRSGNYMGARTAAAGMTKFSFTPAHAGANTVYIASETGGVAALSFNVLKSPSVYIKQVDIPQHIFTGEEAKFSMAIESSDNATESLFVNATIDGANYLSRVAAKGETRLNFTLMLQHPGEQLLAISVGGDGAYDKKSVPLFVYEPPMLSIGKPSFKNHNGQVLATFSFAASNSVRNVLVSFAGQSQTLKSNEASFLVKPGVYPLSARWYGPRGMEYTNSTIINAVIPYQKIDLLGSYPFLFATLVAVLLFFGFYALSKIIKKVRG